MVRMDSPIANFSYCFLYEEERGWMGRVVDEEEIKLPYGPLSLLRPLDLMDYMLVFSNIFGEMCKFQFVMNLWPIIGQSACATRCIKSSQRC